MAKSVVVLASCDQPHEGDEKVTEGVITIQFGYQGKTYETELCPAHVEEYHAWMSDYLTHGAQVVSGAKPRHNKLVKAPAKRGNRQAKGNDPAAIREWAKNNGYLVNERGRISAEVVRAYDELH
jgi:Lsr2